MKRCVEGEGIEGICRIGFTNGGMEVYISEDLPESTPHFYVEDPKDKTVIRIRMDKAEYLRGNQQLLTAAQKDDLITFLLSSIKTPIAAKLFSNHWIAAVVFWNHSYPAHALLTPAMPDYSALPVLENKEQKPKT